MKRYAAAIFASIICLTCLFGCSNEPPKDPPSNDKIQSAVKDYYRHDRSYVYTSTYESINETLEIVEIKEGSYNDGIYCVDVKVTYTAKYSGFLSSGHGYKKECTLSLKYEYSSKSENWVLIDVSEREDKSTMLY